MKIEAGGRLKLKKETTDPMRTTIKSINSILPISCANHEGAGKFAVMQWDGEKFNQVTGWEAPLDPAYIRGLVEASAAKFAAENNITPKVCP